MSPSERIQVPQARTERTAPGHGRTKQFGKTRRPAGNPIADVKERKRRMYALNGLFATARRSRVGTLAILAAIGLGLPAATAAA